MIVRTNLGLGFALVLGIVGGAVACTGEIGDGDSNVLGKPHAGTHPNAPSDKPGADDAIKIHDTPLRRLNRMEYDNTVRDLLGDTTHPASSSFPPDPVVGIFDNNAAALNLDDLLMEGY